MKTMRTLVEGRDLLAVDKSTSVRDAVRRMTERGVGAVAVLTDGRLAGIFTERDLMSRVVAVGRSPEETPVSEVMSTDLLVADVADDYETALRRMQQARMRHLLVLEKGRLAGVVSLRDLLAVEIDEKDEAINLLNAYVHDIPVDLVR